MMNCPICNTKMLLKQHYILIIGKATGSIPSLTATEYRMIQYPSGSIDVYTSNEIPVSYWECPKCGYVTRERESSDFS